MPWVWSHDEGVVVKWKSLSCVQLFVTHGLYSPWNSPGQNTGVGSCSLLQGIFQTQVSHAAGRCFTSWATRERNTRVGSLSLLQVIFPTQKSSGGLLPCRWILYQVSYEGSPKQRMFQPSRHCGCPKLCTLRGLRMEKSRILALESEGTIKGMIPVSPDSFFFSYLEKY